MTEPLDVNCFTCGAQPGRPCVSPGRVARGTPHIERTRRAGWTPRLARSRYRRLRGLVIHGLPKAVAAVANGSRSLLANVDLPQGEEGRCRWCCLPVPPKLGRRLWCDDECTDQFLATLGERLWPGGTTFKAVCQHCEVSGTTLSEEALSRQVYRASAESARLEIDHRMPFHVARAISPKAFALAFMLENLQWLCHKCHVEKTARDRRWLKFLSKDEGELMGLKTTCPSCGSNMETRMPEREPQAPPPPLLLVCLACGRETEAPADIEAQQEDRPRLL